MSHLYRSNIHDALTGEVPAEVVEVAGEGIGVVHVVAAGSMEPALATKVIDTANLAFVDAMTTGFWISVGFIAVGLAASLLLLPNRSRVTQVVRADDDAFDALAATSAAVNVAVNGAPGAA